MKWQLKVSFARQASKDIAVSQTAKVEFEKRGLARMAVCFPMDCSEGRAIAADLPELDDFEALVTRSGGRTHLMLARDLGVLQ